MSTTAGRLRYKVDFQRPVSTQNPQTGEMVQTWEDVWTSVAADIQPLNARELIASRAVQSEVSSKIIIRWRDGATPDMRIKHRSTIYAIDGAIPDKDSGREWLTLLVKSGVSEG